MISFTLYRIPLLAIMLAVVAMFAFVPAADAQTCGVVWETPFTIETNPYPPGSAGEAAWAAVYGESHIVYGTAQVARIDETGCGGEDVMLTSATLVATPSTINAGQQTSLSWGSYNTGHCYGDIFETGGAVSGTVMVSPSVTTTYTLSCSALTPSGEEDTTGARITKQATVTVNATAVTASLTATPGSVASGNSATLTWSSTNAVACTGTGFDTAGAISGTVSTGALSATTNFSVTCTGAGGTGTGATWQYTGSDISDFACPLTDPNRAYGSVPTCPVSPAGKSCTGSPSYCKVNTISGCSINTDQYSCVGGTVTPPSSATASALVTVTPAVCVDATVQPAMWYNAPQTLLWSDTGENSGNGGGLNNNAINNAYQAQCLAECPTGKCNYRFMNDLGGGEPSQTSFACFSVPSNSVLASKPITTSVMDVETMYSALTVPASCSTNMADLSAGGITPTTATVNTAVSLLATISNLGSAHSDAFRDAAVEAEGRLVGYGRDVSGDGLPVLFQIDSDTDHNSGISIKTIGIAGIAGGGTRNANVSHTFATSGTWYVRACADAWGDMTGIVNESNELNNCGPWTPINVTSPTACSVTVQAGQTANFTLTPAGYFAGQQVRYGVKWTGSGAYEYLPDNTTWYYNAPDPQVVSHVYPTVGTYNFVAYAMNTDGSPTQVSINSSPYASLASCTVNVIAPSGSVTSCSASPSTVAAGGSTTWTALPAGIASYTFTPSETGTGVVRPSNTYTRTYATPGTYGMSVTAGGATVACTNNVTVGTPSCGTATPTITATPDRVTTGGTSVLTVQASGVDGTCTVTGPGVNQTLTASSCGIPSTNITTPALTGQSTYTVSCDSGEATAKSVINVSTKWTIF